jgi:signal recognition particle receptor subunit beta
VKDSAAVIFIVDANDQERIPDAVEELQKFLKFEEAVSLPILVLANKQDLPNALCVGDVAGKMDLQNLLKGREWTIFGTCCTIGEGVYEAFDWLAKTIKKETPVL